MTTPEADRPRRRSDRDIAVLLVAAMLLAMWILEVIDQATRANLDQYGIKPHELDGLPGIATAPFLHAGWGHLIGNSIPFLVLGVAIAYSGLARIAATTVIVALVGGLGVWLFAATHTDHIGASGLVFGYATYLMARGFYSRSLVHLLVGIVVIGVYGTTLLSGLVPTDGIS